MAATKAQSSRNGRKNDGKNFQRGTTGERRAAKALRTQGYQVKISKGSRGPADVIARKGNTTRRIQVKNLTSRTLNSSAVAKRRVTGQPFNVPAGRETWVYDRRGRCYKFRT